jgi:hypothetical protein
MLSFYRYDKCLTAYPFDGLKELEVHGISSELPVDNVQYECLNAYPFDGLKELDVHGISGELPVDLDERVAGGHGLH